MITIPAGVRIYLACGKTDMRKGFDGLSMLAQDVLKQDPFSGAIFAFRGDRKSTRLNSSHLRLSRMPSSA